MQAFSFGQINIPGQKNYVFVDEHNRHRRLKVMRACEGCRRRKIKCDAATTNTWPCSACNRLKLHCIPPTMIDQDISESDGGTEVQETSNYQFVDANGLATSQTQAALPSPEIKTYYGQTQNHEPVYQPETTSYTTPQIQAYQPTTQRELYPNLYHSSNQPSVVELVKGGHIYYGPHTTTSHNATMVTPKLERNASEISDQGSSTAEGLSDQLGALKIDECGTAPYLRRPSKFIAEPAAPISDKEIELPSLDSNYGSQIEIPAALMPSDDHADRLLEVYFSEVHPYVPVVNRSQFYQQWQYDRVSISPLLLEAMFACAGRLSDDFARSSKLLALADKHQDSFLDTPRLSTIQALLLLLKAREAVPKRGYYYRSWMMCKTIASMAKDLDIHEHYATHLSAQTCGSDLIECLTKTRVWQTLMVCEMMIGGPQGRYDYEVDLSSVDLSLRPPGPENDPFEEAISLQFAFFVRNVHNIRLVAQTYSEVKNTKDWGAHPKFVANNEVFDKWPEALPLPLQLCFPADGSPPHIPSHFIANMHSHYQLGRIMLQRPQLVAHQSFDSNSAWKHHMMSCYDSAKVLCRLQEAILTQYGLNGLLCMQRGINFTIYAILTCIMLHLVAITSPDPDLNSDAREFFTRHMRILEACIDAWPMQEMRVQIDALREAFSADKTKPFELRATFPYGTPSESYRSSPSVEPPYHSPPISENEPFNLQRAQNYLFQPTTPPISATSRESGLSSPYHQTNSGITSASNLANDSATQYSGEYAQPTLATAEDIQWNPTPIFQQWNTAFSIPQSALAPASSPTPSTQTSSFTSTSGLQQSRSSLTPPNTGRYMAQYSGLSHSLSSASSDQASLIHPQRQQQQQHQQQQQQQQQQHPQQQQQQQTPQVPQTSFSASYVSPREWQQSVASVFNPDGLKRRWDYAEADNQMQKRLR